MKLEDLALDCETNNTWKLFTLSFSVSVLGRYPVHDKSYGTSLIYPNYGHEWISFTMPKKVKSCDDCER